MNIRVAVYEDNPSLRAGLYQLINNTPGFECVGSFQDALNIKRQIRDLQPDVVLMDIGLPGISGIEAMKTVRPDWPEIKFFMQTVFEDTDIVFQAILAGASGYLLKNTPSSRIMEAIMETYEGGAPMSPSVATKVLRMVVHQPVDPSMHAFNLSDREKEILACLVRGMSYKMVAETCAISIDTVRTNIRSIYEKLHVHSKGEAVAKAIKRNIV